VGETFDHVSREGVLVPSLKRDEGEERQMLSALGMLVTAGYEADWSVFYPTNGRLVQLPGLPWQHSRYWLDYVGEGQTAVGSWQAQKEAHPLLGWKLATAVPDTHIWQLTVNAHTHPYLFAHRLQGKALIAASAYVEMGLAAMMVVWGKRPCRFSNITFHQPCQLPKDGTDARLQITLTTGSQQRKLFIHSRSGDSWLQHISAEVSLSDELSAAKDEFSTPGQAT
jgi:myxalamid-type polyketide synthase MxaE and MxaD